MIDVFERLAPEYGRVVRKLAIDVWYDREDVNLFLQKAEFFKRRYANELQAYFTRKGFPFSPKRIKELADAWAADQVLTARKIRTLAGLKKGKLTRELTELDEEKKREVMELAEGARLPVEGSRIVPVISFADNFAARSLQVGEDAAFDLGRLINHEVVSDIGDTYRWTSQRDTRVRKTHRKLAGKIFSYNSPPTTEDEYGHTHTGNPGTDWGCRCYEVPVKGKPLLDYTARA